MADDDPGSTKDFGDSFRTFLEQIAAKPREDAVFLRMLREHFGVDPRTLVVVAESFADHDHVNVHRALEEFLAEGGRAAQLKGVSVGANSLSDLVGTSRSLFATSLPPPEEGPVQYANVSLSEDETLLCLGRALLLVTAGDQRLAVFLQGPDEDYMRTRTQLEVMALERPQAEAVLTYVRTWIRAKNIYRTRVLSLVSPHSGYVDVKVHKLPAVSRDQIILPEGVLDRVERQTIRFGALSERLRAAGRHLKRGLLLHGPPGTGKTLTAMYLAGQMPDRTVLVLTGTSISLVQQSCAMARLLQPSIVILEDVDLVAKERTRPDGEAGTSLLFELLNQMDGLSDDVDVLFLLTTNRPDILEPALAARPGRVDLAVEVPLPDAGCRRRLFDLYGRGMTVQFGDLEPLVERTQGVSAAFIRELLRKAALLAAEERADAVVVTNEHIDMALRELLVDGGELTATLLGARRKVGFSPG